MPLQDIFAVITYYLINRQEVDAYLERQATLEERLRAESEATYSSAQRAFQDRQRKLIRQKRDSE